VTPRSRAHAERTEERRALVARVRARAAELAIEAGASGPACLVLSEAVLAAMERVPRHTFVPPEYAADAYDDRPLPIGFGQTISQPSVVAGMTSLLALGPDACVLEVGTGCGYQAAVLAELARHVYSMERVPSLAERARARLAALGYANVSVAVRDGFGGWPEHAPYDGILVAAAAPHVPPDLVAQLAPGGRMTLPVEGPCSSRLPQTLLAVVKDAAGEIAEAAMLSVAFVPMLRGIVGDAP
jgi:protein-L-isoaspartate(D-aspartate) O-methyltransferase